MKNEVERPRHSGRGAVTDHSDLIAELQRKAAQAPTTFHWRHALLIRAADALSSQSLSLSEAREEIERLRGALKPFARADRALGETPGSDRTFRLETDTGYREIHRDAFRRARSVLENGPAGLADAHTKSPLSDLSSLRKGAEVAPLAYVRPHGCEFLTKAETIIGEACVWTHHEANGAWFWKLGNIASGTEANEADAKKMLWATYETRIRSALVSGSPEDGA